MLSFQLYLKKILFCNSIGQKANSAIRQSSKHSPYLNFFILHQFLNFNNTQSASNFLGVVRGVWGWSTYGESFGGFGMSGATIEKKVFKPIAFISAEIKILAFFNRIIIQAIFVGFSRRLPIENSTCYLDTCMVYRTHLHPLDRPV